ncbi:Hypothetical protein, putative [Bodo saltans]|uniref:Uncharacterized protein n=1 Tax=Bodo saltans TaxID=75058 RepID=A0A0S4JTC8_BODSA|nr:Hypothetical protein, putative [Bodo saltans]|eukprot:CUG93241.1 Hypothetical protein, putative [Bodo saltans]
MRKTSLALSVSAPYASAMAQFSACRQPWSEYIDTLAKADTTPLHVEPQEHPAYRGRLRGREGWLFSQQVQLHYRKFPDERIFANLQRWRVGETVGDISLQQFRNVQPFDIEDKDPQGFEKPSAETYMKLNYKNPATISRFLTRTGHFYPADILPLNPEAVAKLRIAKAQAMILGLYPKFGNPFWQRSQKFRPKAHQDNYDPMTFSTKQTMEHFAYNWVQRDRIKKYFKSLADVNKGKGGQGAATVEQRHQDHTFSPENKPLAMHRNNAGYMMAGIENSQKTPTVPGLMNTAGMKKKFHNLYSSTSRKRMGFTNPVLGIKKV